MGVYDIQPLDRDLDRRANSQYLTGSTEFNKLSPAALTGVFVELEAESTVRSTACERALRQAIGLSKQLLARSSINDVPQSDSDSRRSSNTSYPDCILRRLQKWLLNHETEGEIASTIPLIDCLMPHVTVLEYFGGKRCIVLNQYLN
jgi:hypothetical protein